MAAIQEEAIEKAVNTGQPVPNAGGWKSLICLIPGHKKRKSVEQRKHTCLL